MRHAAQVCLAIFALYCKVKIFSGNVFDVYFLKNFFVFEELHVGIIDIINALNAMHDQKKQDT